MGEEMGGRPSHASLCGAQRSNIGMGGGGDMESEPGGVRLGTLQGVRYAGARGRVRWRMRCGMRTF